MSVVVSARNTDKPRQMTPFRLAESSARRCAATVRLRKSWPGPLSVAIYIEESDADAVAVTKATIASLLRNVIHLVIHAVYPSNVGQTASIILLITAAQHNYFSRAPNNVFSFRTWLHYPSGLSVKRTANRVDNAGTRQIMFSVLPKCWCRIPWPSGLRRCV